MKILEITHGMWREFARNIPANAILGGGTSLLAADPIDMHRIVDDWLSTGGRCTALAVGILTIVNIWITISRKLKDKNSKD